jgi:hypothetical protein
MDCVAPYNDPRRCDMFKAACQYARANDFFQTATDRTNKPTGCVPANDETGASLLIHYPPSTSAGQFAGRPGFVEVEITRPYSPFLTGIFGITSYTVASNAVSAFTAGDSNSNSILVLDPDDCGAFTITGTGGLTIAGPPGVNGGYIMVNSDCGQASDTTQDVCSTNAGAADFGGTGTTTAPHLYVVGACKKHGSATVNWTTTPGVTEDANFYGDPMAGLIGPPASGLGAFCQPLGRRLVPGDAGCSFTGNNLWVLHPGVYYGGIKVATPNVRLDLRPGIYIMAGGGFNPTNGTVDSSAGDVLIYSTDVEQYRGADCSTAAPNAANYCQGDVVINGQVRLHLDALANDPCPPVSDAGCPYAGLLFWMDRTASRALAGNAQIVINGGSDTRISGTVYNPLGHVQINGGSGTTGCSGTNQFCLAIQIVANTVRINGNSTVFLPYDPTGLYHLESQGLVK